MSIQAFANARLVSIAAVAGSDQRGKLIYADPTTFNLDIVLDQPTRSQLATLNVKLVDVTAVAYIPMDLAAGFLVKQSQRMVITPNGRSSQTFEVAHVTEGQRIGSDLSHFAAFLKEVR